MSTNDLGDMDGTGEEDVVKQRMLAQKKEKKIKIIRMFTVVAYLISVSMVASMLSAYYIFVWDPHSANNTVQTTNAERRTSSEYVIANPVDQPYPVNGNLPALLNSPKTAGSNTSPEMSIKYQSSTAKFSTSHIQTTAGNVSDLLTV